MHQTIDHYQKERGNSMKLLVHGRQVKITESIEEHVQKRMERLERHMPQVTEVRVELSHRPTKSISDSFTCQLTMWAKKRILRAEVTYGDIYAAIDKAVDKMDRQIEKVSGRQKHHHRTSLVENTEAILAAQPDIALAMADAQAIADVEMPEMGRIKRRKEFNARMMTEDEAIEQMELLGHDFFLFYNSADDAINLLYRRKDENYGLLQPRID